MNCKVLQEVSNQVSSLSWNSRQNDNSDASGELSVSFSRFGISTKEELGMLECILSQLVESFLYIHPS